MFQTEPENTRELRWRQRFEHLRRAYSRLDAACQQDSYSELELAGLIQMFEFTFELAWKTMKDLLTYEGFEVNSPREAIRVGLSAGLVGDGVVWMEALESRNRFSHTYDAKAAEEAEHLIKDTFGPMIGVFVSRLAERER